MSTWDDSRQPGGMREDAMDEPAGQPAEGVGGGGDVGPEAPQAPRKGPLSFLSGSLTALALAALCLAMSRRVVGYYVAHHPHYEAAIAQSIATALKTLIVGMCFLATFSFAFIGLGLLLVFVRSLLPRAAAEPPRSA
jgi:hypothetical protein